MMIYFVLIVSLFIIYRVNSGIVDTGDDHCDKGEWVDSSALSYAEYVNLARVSLVDNKPEVWLHDACRAQLVQHSCYAHGNTERAKAIENRNWKPLDESLCNPFSPLSFLHAMNGGKMVIVGNSILMQLWVAFVCEMHQLNGVLEEADWFQHHVGHYNAVTCPFGAIHCHIHGGRLKFQSGESLSFLRTNIDLSFDIKNVIATHNLGKGDILLFGLGFSIPDLTQFENFVKKLRVDTDELPLESSPRIFLLEALPQHFKTPTGDGKYNIQTLNKAVCHPIQSDGMEWYENNKEYSIAQATFANSTRVSLIKAAQPLVSQWDAHVETSKITSYDVVDCTHWCYPSGVFKFLHKVIYNAIRKKKT